MIYPKFLSSNSTIGVPAPSDGAYCKEYINRFQHAKSEFEKMGFSVQLSSSLFQSEKGRSNHAVARAEEIKVLHALVKPKYFVPVHGEYKMLKCHEKLATDLGREKSKMGGRFF